MTEFNCTDRAVGPNPVGLEADMDRHVADMEADMAAAHKLVEADPSLPFISALVIAGDLRTAERSKQWVLEGKEPFERAINYVGSYGRFEFALWGIDNGYVKVEDLWRDLPELWRGSDPDDTDPRYLALWKQARVLNDDKYLRDGRALPRGNTVRVYRGQDQGAPLGIAWTTDEAVAQKFARGAATRQANRGGVVLQADVPRYAVIAYITGRNESEVILDPTGLETP